jgi:hypothetical protein
MLGASKHACRAFEIGGSGDMEITGSGIFSNSDGNGGTCPGFYQGGSSTVDVDGGGISSVGPAWYDCDQMDPCPPVTGVPQLELPDIPVPVCQSALVDPYDGLQINQTSGLPYTIQPGNYSSIKINGGIVVFNPGLYCLDGPFTINGGLVTGNRVLFYMESGTVYFSANSEITLSAADNLEDYATPEPNIWDGMLIYLDPSNSSDVKISGNSQSGFTGTIFAPSSECEAEGNGDTISIGAQFICDTILLTGSGTIDLTYDESKNYLIPSTIDLDQ